MKNFIKLAFWTPLVLFLIQLLISLPKASQWLGFDFDTIEAQVIAGFIILALFSINYLIKYYPPYKRFQKITYTRFKLLDVLAERFIDSVQNNFDIEIRLNLMLPERRIFARLEPKENSKKKRFSFFPIVLNQKWASSNMVRSGDKKIKLTTSSVRGKF